LYFKVTFNGQVTTQNISVGGILTSTSYRLAGGTGTINAGIVTTSTLVVGSGGTGYTYPPTVTISDPTTSWGVPASAVAEIKNGSVVSIEIVSNGRGYSSLPTITISSPNVGINTATASIQLLQNYYTIQSSTPISSGICTIVLNENVPYAVGVGTEVPFFKQSRILASSHSFEYIGSGTEISKSLPSTGGVAIQENETDQRLIRVLCAGKIGD